MKKHLIALAIVAAPAFAFAQSANTITFIGDVTTQTCSVLVNGNASTPTVLLPSVPTTALAAAGATAGPTEFTMEVTGCVAPTAAGGAQAISTVFAGNGVTSEGNLQNRAGDTGAKNVALQMYDPATPAASFDLKPAGGVKVPGLKLAVGETSAKHNFAVRYVTEGAAATAGGVLGAVQYAVSYD